MKTLTSSCSKAIVDKNIDKRFSCFNHLSLSRAEVCLLPLKNPVRIRFLHLLSVQHRRLQPVFSSSSLSPDSQVDLETAETHLEEENPSKTAHVKFQLQKECSFGEHFFIVGDHPILGLWDPESAIPLTWSDGHVWTGELDVPVGISIQFKFILKTSNGNLLWQPGADRIFKSWETENTIIICEDWEEAENQKLIEEQPLAYQDGSLLDSGMEIVAKNLTPPKEELVSDVNLVSDADSITHAGKEPLHALSEELATGNSAPSLEKPLAIVADNISYPTEDIKAIANNGVPGVKKTTHPIDEALAIVADNISYPTEDFEENANNGVLGVKKTTHPIDEALAIVADNISYPTEDFEEDANNGVLGVKKTTHPIDEALAISNKNVLVAEDLGNIGRVETLQRPATPDVEGNLVVHEGSPVLVPGLTPLATVSTEEVTLEEDGKNSPSGSSIGVNEAKHQKLPELVEKQENEGEQPEEKITAALPEDDEEQLDSQHIQKPLPQLAREEQPDPEPFQSNILESDVQWGRKTIQKLLNSLRFL